MNVTMLLYPGLTQLDLTGPYEVLSRFPELNLQLVWKTLDAVQDANGLKILPTHTFESCSTTDMLFVPGGPGQIAMMDDQQVLGFLRERASVARYTTSVCTGSLILAATGLLRGRKATCHWTSLDQLTMFDITPVRDRVVVDGNLITGAGVTSGIDFALRLVSELFGSERAAKVRLSLEYDPRPLPGGSPETASAELLVAALKDIESFIERRRQVSQRAAERLS